MPAPGAEADNSPQSFAYQSTSINPSTTCPSSAGDVAWNVKSIIAGDVNPGSFKSSQPFLLEAGSETNDLYWKQFLPGYENIYLSVSYNLPPLAPAGLSTSPGGLCQAAQGNPAQIGNDDVSFSATALDQDGDGNLTTRFVLYNAGGSVAYDSASASPVTSVQTGDNATATLQLSRAVMQGLNGTASQTQQFTYYWQAQTKDGSLTGPWSSGKCWFNYNPKAPPAPVVTPSGTTINAQVGQAVQVSFSPGQTPCGGSGQPPCPATYTYQVGAAQPVTVTADSTSHGWSGTIPIRRVGPQILTVYDTDTSGNVSESQGPQIHALAPATPYADGDVTGDGQPDLLTIGSGGSPGLWLSPGAGPGKVGPAVQIGGAGTGKNPGSGSPADWAGAQVLHGNFAGQGVQDVMAYYPADGTGQVIYGSGDGGPLQPYSGNTATVQGGLGSAWLSNPGFNPTDVPADLVAAGNASQDGVGFDDLIGILGDTSSGYELDLFTANAGMPGSGGGAAGNYGYYTTLAAAGTNSSPDHSNDWGSYTLAAAQPGGPSGTVLFALNTQTGALYESVNPNAGNPPAGVDCQTNPAGCTLIGTGNWAKFTGTMPWGSTPPALASADVNAAGQTELWTVANGVATSYKVTGSGSTLALTAESSATVSEPSHEWPVAEGSGTTAYDTTGGTAGGDNATLTGTTAGWNPGSGDQFAPFLDLGGTSQTAGSYLKAAAKAVTTSSSFTVSAWVRLDAAPGQALPPTYHQAVVSQDGTNDSGFYLMFHADTQQWDFDVTSADTTSGFTWVSALSTVTTSATTWTHLVGVYNSAAGTLSLYVNGTLAGTATPGFTLWNATGPLEIGRDKYKGAFTDYLRGSVADVQTWQAALTTAQVDATGGLAGTGQVISAISGKCLDDLKQGTADGTVIDIYKCNNTAAQNWTVNPGDTLSIFGKCMTVTGGGTANGTLIELAACATGGSNGSQVWKPGASGSLVNPQSGRCLDDPGSSTTDGTQLQIYTCNTTSAQNWTVP
jgi:hypothetical protein